MNNLTLKHWYLIGAWLLINLVQAIFTGLHFDEAYYWMYSRNLDWGFLDHPPMAALFIRLGSSIIPGEIGVRLVIILFSTATLALILNLLKEEEDFFFLVLFVFSFPLMHTHISGFLAISDIPLLFFTMLFLILYKKFTEFPSLKLSLLMALALSAMIYSKYHAFMVIGLTVLSNLKLLRNKYFWVTAVISLILLMPHIIWQMENEFITFRYHLVERTKPFRLQYVHPNLINQLLMAGPFTGLLVFWKLGKFKMKTDFDKTLIYNIVGFYILFFVLSFKNRIEAHWASSIIPMLMVVTYPLISNDPVIKKWFKHLALPAFVLMMLFRIYIAIDFLPDLGSAKITFYKREASALQIKEKAQGNVVGFFNDYGSISNYIFYTGDSAVHFSSPEYRFCQYDLWNDEKAADRKSVFAIQPVHLNPPELFEMANGIQKGFLIIEEFQSLKDLMIEVNSVKNFQDTLTFEIVLFNNSLHPVLIQHKSMPRLEFFKTVKKLLQFYFLPRLIILELNQMKMLQFKFPFLEPKLILINYWFFSPVQKKT
jgi:hypothetical protein